MYYSNYVVKQSISNVISSLLTVFWYNCMVYLFIRVEINEDLLELYERIFDLLENHVTRKKWKLSRRNCQNLSRWRRIYGS